MVLSFLQGLVVNTSTSSNNGNTDFYRYAKGSNEGSDLEEDLLVECTSDSDDEEN